MRLIAVVLVLLTGLVTAGLFILIVFGGPVGEAVASRARLGGAFELAWRFSAGRSPSRSSTARQAFTRAAGRRPA